MTDISDATTVEELAAIVATKLKQHGISTILVGGAVVSIYTHNRWESADLDFIAPAANERIDVAMKELGFKRKGKDFHHPNTIYTVEFPGRRLAIGNDEPVVPGGRKEVPGIGVVTLLSATQAIMDRLLHFFLYNDRQALEQAVAIAQLQGYDLGQIRDWAGREGKTQELRPFLQLLELNPPESGI